MRLSLKLWVDYYVGGLLIVLLKPPTVLLGKLLRRDHGLTDTRDITVLKLLGGGSLVNAYPALLAIRRARPDARLRLLASPATAAFGQSLGLFDEILVVRDGGLAAFVGDTLRALRALWRADTLIDLEVHSRLTTVLCVMTCARNRVGFYTQESFWRVGLSTHLLFFHGANGIWHFYDQLARVFDAAAVSMEEASGQFRRALGLPPRDDGTAGVVAVAPCCSDLSRERMLRVEEWAARLADAVANEGVHTLDLLGGPNDVAYLDALADAVLARAAAVTVRRLGGRLPLVDSVRRLDAAGRLLAIDSALLHYARLLGVPTEAYFGPTSPKVLLRPSTLALDVIHYGALPCSPCVHVVATPPCRGNNLCMRVAFDPRSPADRNPPWQAQDTPLPDIAG